MSLVDEVLQSVNAARVAAGYAPLNRLRNGQRGSAQRCPIARSLSELDASVATSVSIPNHSRNSVRVGAALGDVGRVSDDSRRYITSPGAFREFISAFDSGRGYGEYLSSS